MSRRPRHRGERVPGLFGFEEGQPTTEVDEVPDNPRARRCPWCHARPEEPCVTATRGGRIRKDDYHPARMSPQETE